LQNLTGAVIDRTDGSGLVAAAYWIRLRLSGYQYATH